MVCDRRIIRKGISLSSPKIYDSGNGVRYCFTMTHVTNNMRFFSIFQTIYDTDEYAIWDIGVVKKRTGNETFFLQPLMPQFFVPELYYEKRWK